MSGDLTRIDEWIYSQLATDVQLAAEVGSRIYVDSAPQNATGKLVIFSFLGGADKFQTLNANSRTTNAIYLIRAISPGQSYSLVEAAADRIDVLMIVPNQGALVRDTLITSVVREQPHQRKDLENGTPFVYQGGFYRIRYQPAP